MTKVQADSVEEAVLLVASMLRDDELVVTFGHVVLRTFDSSFGRFAILRGDDEVTIHRLSSDDLATAVAAWLEELGGAG